MVEAGLVAALHVEQFLCLPKHTTHGLVYLNLQGNHAQILPERLWTFQNALVYFFYAEKSIHLYSTITADRELFSGSSKALVLE